MKNMNYGIAVLALALCCANGASGYAQSYAQDNGANPAQQNDNAANAVQPDNTQVNERDQGANAVTADQQQDNQADRSITQRIRRAIIGDKSLSLYAHNVKVITQGGVVTLKGPVRSTREKDAIVKKAVDVTGSADKVTDQISIKRKSAQ
jgi:osmotically-inducible protein OsmY